MIYLAILTFMTTLSLPALASDDLACATAMGGYNEIEKFQIRSQQYVTIGDSVLESHCLAENETLKCNFRHNSLMPYSLEVNLKTKSGYIKQSFRSKHYVSCRNF